MSTIAGVIGWTNFFFGGLLEYLTSGKGWAVLTGRDVSRSCATRACSFRTTSLDASLQRGADAALNVQIPAPPDAPLRLQARQLHRDGLPECAREHAESEDKKLLELKCRCRSDAGLTFI